MVACPNWQMEYQCARISTHELVFGIEFGGHESGLDSVGSNQDSIRNSVGTNQRRLGGHELSHGHGLGGRVTARWRYNYWREIAHL